MKHAAISFLLVLGVLVPAALLAADKPRVIVLTDISNEPDDEGSLVRFLVYSNEYDVEGLIATTSTWLRSGTRPDLILRDVEAYGQVRENLLRHAPGFPAKERLLEGVKAGNPGYGMAAAGAGKSSDGSRRIVEVVDRPDPRPVWVSVWGGANTLAQALWDVKETRPPAALESFVSRLRVYTISDQDDAGRWLRDTFPGLFYIVSPSTQDWKEYWRATWTGISGDRHYRNGPGHKFALVDNPWLEENVIDGHGPLGALYPKLAFIMEGDTPSFLGLVGNGLGWTVSPAYGGWGGRYALYRSYSETRPIWTNDADSRDTVAAEDGKAYTSDQATIWRWREDFQNDFAARMDWCVAADPARANHNPVAILNGDATKDVLPVTAAGGTAVRLSAEGSRDPDGNALRCRWFVYREAGTFDGEVKLSCDEGPATALEAPPVKVPSTVHVILTVTDDGAPRLWSYRRAVVTVVPAYPPAAQLPDRPGLPDPLASFDGKRIGTPEEWAAQRRPELKALFQHYMYGFLPPAPARVEATVTRCDPAYLGGKATLKEIELRFGPPAAPAIHLLLVVPNAARPAPVFLGLNFRGNQAAVDDPAVRVGTDAARGSDRESWCIESTLERGFAVATFHNGDVEPDRPDAAEGVRAAYLRAGLAQGGPQGWGTIAAWAWGLSRAVDYLVGDHDIDPARITVFGHSRNGKAALLAAAFDERIALAIPHQAGCGGTAPSRGKVGESVRQINDRFPHWFCGEFKAFNDRPDRLPFDQHLLIALVAPRPVLLSNATKDTWANPDGQFEMLRAADPVYRLLGSSGLEARERPAPGQLSEGKLGYFIREGEHSTTREDWDAFIRFAMRHLR